MPRKLQSRDSKEIVFNKKTLADAIGEDGVAEFAMKNRATVKLRGGHLVYAE
jgi:hypothetical protein